MISIFDKQCRKLRKLNRLCKHALQVDTVNNAYSKTFTVHLQHGSMVAIYVVHGCNKYAVSFNALDINIKLTDDKHAAYAYKLLSNNKHLQMLCAK